MLGITRYGILSYSEWFENNVAVAIYQVSQFAYNETKDFLGEDRERIYNCDQQPFLMIRDGNWTYYRNIFDSCYLFLWTDEAAVLAKLLIEEI